MIFDTWAEPFSASYREFSLEYIQRVLSQLKRNSARADPGHRLHKAARLARAIAATGCIALAWIGASTSETRAGESAPTPRSRAISIPVLLASPESSAARFRRRSSPSGEIRPRVQSWHAFRSSRLRKRGCSGRRSARIEPEISLTGGKTQSCA